MKLNSIQIFDLYLDSIQYNGVGIETVINSLAVSFQNGHFTDPSFFDNYFKQNLLVELSSLEYERASNFCENYIFRIKTFLEILENQTLTFSDAYYSHIEDRDERAIIETVLEEMQIRKNLNEANDFFKNFIKTRSIFQEESEDSKHAISKIQFNLTVEMLATLFQVMWETPIKGDPNKKILEGKEKAEFARKAVQLFKPRSGRQIGYDYFYDSFSSRNANALNDIVELLKEMRKKASELLIDIDEES